MQSAPRSFLLFLRKLVSFYRKPWEQLTRGLWYIFALLRLHFSPRHPKKGEDICRNIPSQPDEHPATAVICASRLPPPLTPIVGGDIPTIAAPIPALIQVRLPTFLNPEYSPYENHATDRLGVEGYFPEESGPISRSDNYFPGHDDEPESVHVILSSPNREDFTSNPPVTSSRPISRPTSQDPYRPASQYGGYRPPSPRCGDRSPAPSGLVGHCRHSTVASLGPTSKAPSQKGGLRPMIGVGRYKKCQMVIVPDVVYSHVSLPVTTQFAR